MKYSSNWQDNIFACNHLNYFLNVNNYNSSLSRSIIAVKYQLPTV